MIENNDIAIFIPKTKLAGEISISGAKNSSLKLLTASLLTKQKLKITNTPNSILDFQIHVEMLKVLGKSISETKDSIIISENANLKTILSWNGRSIRNTLLILGALLTRFGEAKVPLPGGCNLGDRKYDLHIDIVKKLGADIWEEDGYLCAKVKQKRLIGNEVHLPIRSTGATENGILMGTLAIGTTKIWNPHVRPEIIDLITMLNKMGAIINVNGQESITIQGVEELVGTEHVCIPDNMEALTFIIGTAISGGEVEINNFPFNNLEVPIIFLREAGLSFFFSADKTKLIVKNSKFFPFEISTGPYPGINSDMQPLFAAFALFSNGITKISDLRFSGRFQYAFEFEKLGAKVSINNDALVIHGGKPLISKEVTALDLRAGAALMILATKMNEGLKINRFQEVFRGYNNILEKLEKLGVKHQLL